MHLISRTALSAFIVALAPATAGAVIVTETAGQNDTFATAQAVGGAEVTGISGTLGDLDADLYRFDFTAPVEVSFGDLTPDVNGDTSVQIVDFQFGTQDSLVAPPCIDCWFSASGTGDTVIGPVSLLAGTYFLGVSAAPETSALAPLGDYTFSVNAVTSAVVQPVPLPTSLAGLLLGVGLLGAIARRRS